MNRKNRIRMAALAAVCGLAWTALPAFAQTATRFEETDPSVTLSYKSLNCQDGYWVEDSSKPWSGGAAATTTSWCADAQFAFYGTSVSWIGERGPQSEIVQVLVDGQLVASVDTYSKTDEVRVPIFTINGLAANTRHVLEIHGGSINPAASSPLIVVDAFDVPGPAVSRVQETDPDVTLSPGWVHDNPVVTFVPGPTTGLTQGSSLRDWSAGAAALSTTPGATATFSFTGTAVSWIGARGTQSGIARVTLDGGPATTVDLYSPKEQIQAEVYKATGLADTTHTLTVEATGTQNPAAQNALVVVDVFEVTAPGSRYQETDPAIAYGSGWIQGNRDKAYDEGTTAETNTAGAQASFTFTGTGVRWIGARGPQTGMARVWLDGALVGDLDMYAMTEGPQHTVFAAQGLAAGTHTLAIQVLQQTNPAATDRWVLIDAFDVIP
ncbi:MAG: hypothetical protein ACREVC_08550 [Burkholderiales bacterium]